MNSGLKYCIAFVICLFSLSVCGSEALRLDDCYCQCINGLVGALSIAGGGVGSAVLCAQYVDPTVVSLSGTIATISSGVGGMIGGLVLWAGARYYVYPKIRNACTPHREDDAHGGCQQTV